MVKSLTRAVAMGAILVAMGAATIYEISKPYQQDRILIALGLKAR